MSSNLKVNTILPSAGSNIGLGTNGGNLNVDGGCKVQVGTALTLGHTVGVQFATQNLHSAGFEVNNINASGIITASQFKGDGSNLTGISGVSIANQGNDRLITATGTTDALNGESSLTYSSTGDLTQTVTVDGKGIVLSAGNLKPMITGDANRAAEGNTILGISGKWNGTEVARIAVEAGADTTNKDDATLNFSTTTSGGSLTKRMVIDSSGHALPGADNSYDLGSSSKRWRNVYTTDLKLSNEGKTNDVDGTWGDWTLQEGENDIFMINNRSGKKFKIKMEEVS